VTDDGYTGPATLTAAGSQLTVDVRLSGRVEPVDGRYHWAGRIAPQDAVSRLVRAGTLSAILRIGDNAPVAVRLGDVDPWGAVRVQATSPPPWPGSDADEPEEPEDETTLDVAIIGAGFGGLGAAIRLRQAGVPDFLVFEKADDIGGTWQANTYPGCACDVPSHLYSFSFALNPDWSYTFSGQPEIWDYLRRCVDRFGIRPHLRLSHTVLEAAWDEPAQRWRIETSRGVFTARALISATGPLSEPSIPDIAGLDSFQGSVFHSARWRGEHDLTGRRVAVVGTGASAIQLIPAIAPRVAALTVFQRTPPWVMPRRSRPISSLERGVYRTVPGAQRLARTGIYWAREALGVGFLHPRLGRAAQTIAARHLRRQVPDPALRAKLTPAYSMGCKRVLLSNDYYPALTRDNVNVVVEPIQQVRPHGIVTADGVAHEVDTLIFGTGFHATDPPMARRIRGRNGRTLAEAWTPTMRAHLGTTVAGFPNLFLLLGPNTGLGHTSVVLMIESQLTHIVAALRHLRRSGLAAIEPVPQAQRRYADRVDAKMASTIWAVGGCRSWYLDANGHNSTIWPGFATTFRLRLRRFRAADYRPAPVAAPAVVREG
jgi:cation diffusion facilitator CzcD-associated flavoprotein CzcO